MPFTRMKCNYETLYQSVTLTGDGNSGGTPIPTPATMTGTAIFPVIFGLIGTGLATDETLALTVSFYLSTTAVEGGVGTLTFDTMTAATPRDLEIWPGDANAWGANRDFVPLPPYMILSWVLAGTTKSMSFELKMMYLTLDTA